LQVDMQADIKIKVVPRSSRNQIQGLEEGVLKVKVTSPPIEGKANRDLLALLSRELDIPKRDIEILSGKGSRLKLIRFHGLSFEDIRLKLGRHPDR